MSYDFIIIGGGIVGLSAGLALTKRFPNKKILVIEKEKEIAMHQTGRNSGVIHSGVYYRPNSLKAKYALEGSKKLVEHCKQNDINYDICGKIILATEKDELPQLDHLYKRALQHGINANKICKEGINKIEPHASGICAIKLPMTGITNYADISQSFARIIQDNNGEISLNTEVNRIREGNTHVEVETTKEVFQAKYLINCAGLQSDRIARLAGYEPGMKIVPFKGEYYKLKEDKSYLVKNLIYPVPNPKFPFLGVHLTRMINGEVHAGPNAVLSLHREGYNKLSFKFKDTMDTVSYPAFWKIARDNFKYGMDEMIRFASKEKFAKALQRLVPTIQQDDLIPTDAGIRAQSLTKSGKLVDDFFIIKNKRSIHVCNAPSPAATASIAIGEHISSIVGENNSFI